MVNVIGAALNEHIEFRILNPTELFRIGLTSGAVVTTGIRFDREEQQYYELIIEARSNAPLQAASPVVDEYPLHDKPRIAHVIVNVTILDINDNSPMFVNLPYYAIVSVDAERGSLITKVHAIDADAYENGEVRYEMKRGHGELFKVDRKTGEVTLKQTLEGHNRDFELLIAAYDGGITPFSTDVTVFVKVKYYAYIVLFFSYRPLLPSFSACQLMNILYDVTHKLNLNKSTHINVQLNATQTLHLMHTPHSTSNEISLKIPKDRKLLHFTFRPFCGDGAQWMYLNCCMRYIYICNLQL